jgi:hypothetical protein
MNRMVLKIAEALQLLVGTGWFFFKGSGSRIRLVQSRFDLLDFQGR